MRCRWAAFAGLALLAADGAIAQQTPPVRVRGAIEKVDGNTLTVKARDGATLTVAVPDNVRVMALVRASLADIEPNSYIGITADPQDDGTQKAIAIHIFPEAMRGTGEGYRPWDLRPGATMASASCTCCRRRSGTAIRAALSLPPGSSSPARPTPMRRC